MSNSLAAQDPMFLHLGGDLVRGVSEEIAARLYHLADVQLLRESDLQEELRDSPFLVASVTPSGSLAERDIGDEREELRRLSANLFSGGFVRWSARGIALLAAREASRQVQVEFRNTGRTVLFSRRPFSQEGSSHFVASGVLDRTLLGFGVAAAKNAGSRDGVAHVSLLNVKGLRLRLPPNTFSNGAGFREDAVAVSSRVEFSTRRVDEAMRPLVRKVWRAADMMDSVMFTEEHQFKGWDRAFAWVDDHLKTPPNA